MSVNRVSFFPVGNGDTTLIETDGKTILTDVHYRSDAEDDDEPEYDFASDLQDACFQSKRNYHLSLFVLTHPDRDHLGGFEKLFYSGDPAKYADRPKEDDKLILIDEIWISPYSANPNDGTETDASKPVFKEIQRRRKLQSNKEIDGNRILVLEAKDATVAIQTFSPNIEAALLAPTNKESKVPESESDESQPSTNDTSLTIRWSIKVDGGENHLLLGGDATVEIWDRIWKSHKKNTDKLSWHILLAPHHCSRGAMARKNDQDKYDYSEDALSALGEVEGDGFVVASSKEIKRNDDNPPSWEAKQKYLGILKSKKATNHESRFLNPDTHKDGKPKPVVFDLTKSGPSLKVAGTENTSKGLLGAGASIAPTYG
ncbi:MAG: hypothetical protein HY938_09395 [Nitrosomonadales bacterium]|nr:hypothetical protein [Nitrosomonadales bacterium]